MIRVERKPLKHYVFRREQSLIAHTDVSAFDARRYLCTPGFAVLLTLTTTGVFSFASRAAFVLLLTEIICLAVLFYRTRIIADRLLIRRLLPAKALREYDTAEIIVEVRNRSDFEISTFIIDDNCDLAKDPRVRLAPESLGPRSSRRLTYKCLCDGGMGKLKIGPLSVTITDLLGIFEFRIVEDELLEVDVYPKVELIPQVAVRPSFDSVRYGNYEAATRGLSVNFSGVRPYERGDSLRHIAWKLSTRGQGLLVKEFEKVVSCDVNIVLNLSPAWQIGRHAASTWEYGKDVALSIVQQQLDLGNSVAFFSERTFLEAGAGPDHFHAVARLVANLALPGESDGIMLEPRPVLGTYRDFYSRGSNIFYITPFNLAEFRQSEIWLKRLRGEGFNVTCIFIDTNSFWLQFIESISTGLLIGAKLMLGIEEAAHELEKNGIRTFVVKNKVPLQNAFRERVTQ